MVCTIPVLLVSCNVVFVFSFGKEPKAYLKTNLATFMECQDALVTMHNKLTWDENQKVLCLDKLNMLLQGNFLDVICFLIIHTKREF